MNTQVEFKSSKFPPYDGEEQQINPGIWGRRLAEFLAQRLTDKAFEIQPPIAEDWGYYLPIRNDGFSLAVCCGHQDGADDEFLCFTDPSTPKIKKLFRTIDASAQLARLIAALEQILAEDPEIRDVEWSAPQ
jgi:hypothetical protein